MDSYKLNHPADAKKLLQRAVDLKAPDALATEAKRVIASIK